MKKYIWYGLAALVALYFCWGFIKWILIAAVAFIIWKVIKGKF